MRKSICLGIARNYYVPNSTKNATRRSFLILNTDITPQKMINVRDVLADHNFIEVRKLLQNSPDLIWAYFIKDKHIEELRAFLNKRAKPAVKIGYIHGLEAITSKHEGE